MKKLPVGQQDFEKLILKDCVYVDKTAYIHQMMMSGGDTFFMSRPRRFGKSLFLSTVKAIFEGKKELFKGLYIEDKIDWDTYPVITLDMTLNSESTDTLKLGLVRVLETIAERNDVLLEGYEKSPSDMLNVLINRLYLKTGKQVVVLVDEYDKPILDQINDPDQANAMRGVLYSFYGTLKAASSYLKFLMVTGITKISQTSIFSGFNNLNDLSFDGAYAGICGYTQQELEHFFAGYIDKLADKKNKSIAEILAAIKYWYNGYSWDGRAFVYNPYSVLLLFEKGLYRPFWYSTGTPTFLLKLLNTGTNLETVLKNTISVPDTFTDGQTIEKLNSIGLMFQSGYLTIKSFDEEESSYELQIPNEEVRKAISELVLTDIYLDNISNLHVLSKNIRLAFSEGNTAFAVENLDILLSNTTHNTHESNQNESHYQALFQLAMILSGIDHTGESTHGGGRTDAVLSFKTHVYVVEIKYAATKKGVSAALAIAMKQIKEKTYQKPYLNQGKTVHLLALAFSKDGLAFEEEVI